MNSSPSASRPNELIVPSWLDPRMLDVPQHGFGTCAQRVDRLNLSSYDRYPLDRRKQHTAHVIMRPGEMRSRFLKDRNATISEEFFGSQCSSCAIERVETSLGLLLSGQDSARSERAPHDHPEKYR